ncbi:hypothetical protein [Paraburkholderia aspalathi]|uniref:hypothetical protein n=1 Tax=Paraburkholderia aspalathi TaxID=1324617 RepID=UPI001B092E19|nr:hypothetical protein [Paraburkholderia aspalathi]CAE6842469.1 hypothetical protein R20943_07180 [Paraburkholderia aspalathi]
MFLPIEIQSINHREQLLAGEYATNCAVYSSLDGKTVVMHYEYTRVGAAVAEACDLLFVEESGATRMCDFVRMPDRSWRDSFGARSDSLLDLLPAELAEYRLLEERQMGSQIVGEGA